MSIVCIECMHTLCTYIEVHVYVYSFSLSHSCSDVQCGMLFCQSSGQYQRTASVSVTIATVPVTRTLSCL